jgi:hypothetical protein
MRLRFVRRGKMNVTFTDNTDAIRSAFEEGVARALEKCGLLAGAAKKHGARKCCRQARGNDRTCTLSSSA